jgi:hypothetical protein
VSNTMARDKWNQITVVSHFRVGFCQHNWPVSLSFTPVSELNKLDSTLELANRAAEQAQSVRSAFHKVSQVNIRIYRQTTRGSWALVCGKGELEGSTSLGGIVIGAEGAVCLPLTSADFVYLVIVCFVFWSKYFLF